MTKQYFNNPFFVGFDEMLAKWPDSVNTNYPPFNIKRTDESQYVVEMAVAGFREEDIEIKVLKNILEVSGVFPEEESKSEFIHQGISRRDFKKSFKLADNIEATEADLKNGLLRIWLDKSTSEEEPQKIKIN